jgi:aromatic-L-amino-acid/L-tryptophan decarboxylase
MPGTAVINGASAIRPCFVGARTTMAHADALGDEVIEIGRALTICRGLLASTTQPIL